MEMGEAACLMRSVSQPLFASCELREGDPLRALTTSISFGRFLNEPLDWEKWSSFSHNRTLEDVKKYSRPGAVAEKKAFFEAYYKKFASNKKSEKSPKKENKPPNPSPQTYVTTDFGSVDISNTNKIESPTLAADENMRSIEPEISSNEDVCSPTKDDIISSASQMEQDTASTNRVHEMEMTSKEDVCSPSTTNPVFLENENVDDMPNNRDAEMQITSNKDLCSPANLVSSKLRNVDDKNKTRQIKDKLPVQKKPAISSVSRKASAPAIRPSKAARDEMETKRSALQSLSPRNKNGTSKTLSKPKEKCSEVPLTRLLSSNGVKKNSQVPRVETKRSKPLLDSSVTGSKTDLVKPLSTNISEASTACTKKSRSITIPWSFSFRSEERAAKRKAFFQKLEEKGNTDMTKKMQLQPKMKVCNSRLLPLPLDKARNDNKKLRWSTALEAKPVTSGAKEPSDSIQKVPPTRSCLSELGRKLTPRLVKDACYHRPPPRMSPSKPKNFIEINKKILTSSVMASLPSKKRHDIQK